MKFCFVDYPIRKEDSNFESINNIFISSLKQTDFILRNILIPHSYEIVKDSITFEEYFKLNINNKFIYWPLQLYCSDFEFLNQYFSINKYSLYDFVFVEKKYNFKFTKILENKIPFIYVKNGLNNFKMDPIVISTSALKICKDYKSLINLRLKNLLLELLINSKFL